MGSVLLGFSSALLFYHTPASKLAMNMIISY